MDWVQALLQYIASSGYGTLGVDLFEGDMVDDGQTTPVMALNEYNGRTDDTMTSSPVAVEIPGLQLSVKHVDYPTAKKRIKDVRGLLLNVQNQTINGVRFIAIRPNGTLHDLNRDAANKQRFTANLEVHI